MPRIQKISRYLRYTLSLIIVLFPVLWGLSWLGYLPFVDQYIKTPEGLIDLSKNNLPPLSRFVCWIGNGVQMLPFFLGLLVMRGLFTRYSKGEIFTFENIHSFKQLGWLFFVYSLILEPIGQTIMILGATLSNPPGHRFLTLSLGSVNIEGAISGFCLLVISWVMKEGLSLHDDQKLTI